MLCTDFFCISKLPEFQRISKYRKLCIFLKRSLILNKGMDSYVSNADFNRNSWKRARFDEKRLFFYHLKKRKLPRYILEVTQSAHFGKTRQSHVELIFLFLLLLFFCFSLILSLLVLFLFFILWNTENKHLK